MSLRGFFGASVVVYVCSCCRRRAGRRCDDRDDNAVRHELRRCQERGARRDGLHTWPGGARPRDQPGHPDPVADGRSAGRRSRHLPAGTLGMPAVFSSFSAVDETFTLTARDDRGIEAAPSTFRQVFFGFRAVPDEAKPRATVRYTARGFVPGRPVYAHFRFAGRTRATVRLGVAKGTVRDRLAPDAPASREGSHRPLDGCDRPRPGLQEQYAAAGARKSAHQPQWRLQSRRSPRGLDASW